MEEKSPPMIETVKERIGDTITESSVRDATKKEIKKATKKFKKKGICNHKVVQDTYTFPYITRNCYICGKSLGYV